MIFDSISNLNKYKGLYRNLDYVIEYIMSNNLEQLICGRNEILGNDIYVNVVNTETKKISECVYELHRQYMDLHIDIDGEEQIAFCDRKEEEIISEYDEKGDYELLQGDLNSMCHVDNMHFVLCMVNEPHMPCIDVRNKMNIKKAIFKILV